jgi:hypothetical protein
VDVARRAEYVLGSAYRSSSVVPLDGKDAIVAQLHDLGDPSLHDRSVVHELLETVADPKSEVAARLDLVPEPGREPEVESPEE